LEVLVRETLAICYHEQTLPGELLWYAEWFLANLLKLAAMKVCTVALE